MNIPKRKGGMEVYGVLVVIIAAFAFLIIFANTGNSQTYIPNIPNTESYNEIISQNSAISTTFNWTTLTALPSSWSTINSPVLTFSSTSGITVTYATINNQWNTLLYYNVGLITTPITIENIGYTTSSSYVSNEIWNTVPVSGGTGVCGTNLNVKYEMRYGDTPSRWGIENYNSNPCDLNYGGTSNINTLYNFTNTFSLTSQKLYVNTALILSSSSTIPSSTDYYNAYGAYTSVTTSFSIQKTIITYYTFPTSETITLTKSYPDTNYAVVCTPSISTTLYITSKTTTSFTVSFTKPSQTFNIYCITSE